MNLTDVIRNENVNEIEILENLVTFETRNLSFVQDLEIDGYPLKSEIRRHPEDFGLFMVIFTR